MIGGHFYFVKRGHFNFESYIWSKIDGLKYIKIYNSSGQMLQRILFVAFFLFCLRKDMIKFIKASLREFKHVVWPTSKETKIYFLVVMSILILFGVYLTVADLTFSKIIFTLRDYIKR